MTKRIYADPKQTIDITPLPWYDRPRLALRMARWKIRNNRRVVLLIAWLRR